MCTFFFLELNLNGQRMHHVIVIMTATPIRLFVVVEVYNFSGINQIIDST